MKIKTVLLVIGMAMLAVETWADGPAGPVPIGEVYEVMVPEVLFPGDELTQDEVKMLVMLGVLRLEVDRQSDIQFDIDEGQSCHLVVYWNGNDCWVLCNLGRGAVRCPCWYSTDPNVN